MIKVSRILRAGVYIPISAETENGSAEGYVTDSSTEPALKNWLEKEGCNIEELKRYIQSPIVAILKNMYVEDDARGKGEGNLLMEHILEAASSAGAGSVILLADTLDLQNESGFNLVYWYEGWGFEKVYQTSSGPIMILNNG